MADSEHILFDKTSLSILLSSFENNIRRIGAIESFLAITYTILLFGMTVPYGFPLFFPFIVICFAIFCIKKRFSLSLNVFYNLGIILFFLCIVFYFMGMLNSGGIIYSANVRDVKNILGLVFIVFILGNFDSEKYKKFLRYFNLLIVPVMSVVAVLSLFNFHRLIIGGDILFINMEKALRWTGATLTGSRNMFALGMFAGLLGGLSGFHNAKSSLLKFLYLFSIGVMGGVLILSGSRRAWVILGIMVVFGGARILSIFMQYIARGLSGLIDIGVTKIVILCSVFGILLGGTTLLYNKHFTMERERPLKKVSYRLETLFDEEGMFTEAFSKRTERWTYAASLLEGYSFFEMLFGKGFDYLDSFSAKFHPEKAEGNPHNFFLSAALYSGLIGAIVVVFFIGFGFLKLLRNRKMYGQQFVVFFIIALIFAGIGGNSIFSVKSGSPTVCRDHRIS